MSLRTSISGLLVLLVSTTTKYERENSYIYHRDSNQALKVYLLRQADIFLYK
jgi:hypothetical protein